MLVFFFLNHNLLLFQSDGLVELKRKLTEYQHLSTIGKALDDGYVRTIAEITQQFFKLYRKAIDLNNFALIERTIKE